MGICCCKENVIDKERVFILDDQLHYDSSDISELGFCDLCKVIKMVKWQITVDNKSLCSNCELLYAVRVDRGGSEEFYEIDLDS